MPTPIELLLVFKHAMEHLQAGRITEARDELFRFEIMLHVHADALTPYERMLHLAAVAHVLKECNDFAGAAKRLEVVCQLAVRLEPDSSKTYGDLYDLAECY